MPDPGLCQCGCGSTTTIWRGKPRKFIAGHHARGEHNGRFGKPVSQDTRRKVSEANLLAVKEGRHPTAKGGWKHTEATKLKLRQAHERSGFKARTPKSGVTHICVSCGKPYYRVKSVTQTNYCSLHCSGVGNCTGEKNPFYGKTHTSATRAKLSELSAIQRSKAPVLPTKPEKIVHEELERRGLVFLTEHVLGGKFCVDIFIPNLNLVVYVDGCYWHACPEHFPKAKRPSSDNSRIPYLTKCGFKVGILWEHEIKNNVRESLERLLSTHTNT